MRNKLYIGNLAPTGDEELGSLLARFGVVRYAAVVAGDGAAPGGRFGVVEMQTEEEAEAAIRALNGSEFRGRPVEVRWATPPERTACGHPAMFGTMNVTNGDQSQAPPELPGRSGDEAEPARN